MGAVVETDGEDLRWSWHGCLQLLGVDLTHAMSRDRCAPVDQTLPVVEHSLRVGREQVVARQGDIDDVTIDEGAQATGEIEQAHGWRAYAPSRSSCAEMNYTFPIDRMYLCD